MAQKFKTLHRDISWMYFNHRILQEARREDVPLLERMSFLGIYSNNLDEFFRVRVASINRILECSDNAAAKERVAAKALMKQINHLNNQYADEFQCAVADATETLRREKIYLLREEELDKEQQTFVQSFFRSKLAGTLQPLWFDRVKQFDTETDDCIYLAVRLRLQRKRPACAIVPLPVESVGRFVLLPERGESKYLMYLDDAVRSCMKMVFPGMPIEGFEAYSFKFTKDAEMEIDNDLRNGLLQKISKGVKSRRQGLPLRLIYDKEMPPMLLRKIMSCLDSARLDTALPGGRYQNHRDLMRFPSLGRTDLHYPEWKPVLHSALSADTSIFDAIRERDRLLHVPYHSFDSYIRLLREAAINPAVKSISTTLYRLAKDSKVVKALICAAKNGKKVTVVIELLARFDEASNINWSKRMQEAGVNVIFGVEGLKVHSKITLITFRTGSDIACISTGNFHEGNARCYTDCLLLTARRNIVQDVQRVFHFIERPYSPVRFRELLVSPNDMKRVFLRLIDTEIKNHLAGRPAWIKIKINHITDPDMVNKLYDAASAGVPVDLLVRGNCSLLPNQEGFNGKLRIRAIIDRYLEHSRIFLFGNGGEEKCFMGSADWMPRNLDYRVEVVTPVFDPSVHEELCRIVDCGLRDTRQGRTVDGCGGDSLEAIGSYRSQEELYKHYRADEALPLPES